MTRLLLLVLLCLPTMLLGEDFSDLYEKLSPTVVTIHTSNSDGTRSQASGQASGLGTGIVIEPDKIITAAHVVHTASSIQVKFKDGYTTEAEIVTSIPASDVALLQLINPPDNIVIAEVADSNSVRVGEPVFVIGAPYGTEQTLSLGNLTGRLSRGLMAGGEPVSLLQTDTALNQGNSGGPLFSKEGKVIGIVSFILTKSGGFNGIGFAVSINGALNSLTQASDFWLGFDGILLNSDFAAAINVPQPTGMLVQHVVAGSAADKAGLRGGKVDISMAGNTISLGGDVVLAIAGIVCDGPHSFDEIKSHVASLPDDEDFVISVLRGGRIIDITVAARGGNS